MKRFIFGFVIGAGLAVACDKVIVAILDWIQEVCVEVIDRTIDNLESVRKPE
jgi:hypothetical protein